VRDLRKQMAEDNVIFDNKIHVPSPALADRDGPILPFRKWAAQFYVADPASWGRGGELPERKINRLTAGRYRRSRLRPARRPSPEE
jgi:hypothetical protein